MASTTDSPPQQVVRPNRRVVTFLAILALGCIAGGAAIGALQEGDGAVVGGGFLAVAGLALAWVTIVQAMLRVEVHEWGLVRRSVLGSVRMSYSDVVALRRPAGNYVRFDPLSRLKLVGKDGKVLSMAMIPQGEASVIMKEALRIVLARLGRETKETIARGEAVTFGTLTLGPDGLRVGNAAPVAWANVDHTSFSPEGFRIFVVDRPEATIIVRSATPNLDLVQWLCVSMLADARRSAAATGAAPGDEAPAEPAFVRGFDGEDPILGKLVTGRAHNRIATISGVLISAAAAAGAGAALALAKERDIPGMLMVAGVVLFVGLLAMFAAANTAFAVYERGLRTGRGFLKWDDVEHLTHEVIDRYVNGAYSGRSVTLGVRGLGAHLKLSGAGAKMEGWANAALDRAMPPLVRRRMREVDEGGGFQCGGLEVRKDGLTWKGETVARDGLHAHDLRQGWLMIWLKGGDKPWAQVRLGIEDAPVLVALVRRFLRA